MIAQLDSAYARCRPTKVVSRVVSYALFEGRPATTRGRWINPLVFAVHHLAARLPQLKRVDRPIFVVGTGRSGTTILGLLLSMHRDVAFLNEPKALWHVVRSDEDIIGSYTKIPGRYRLDEADATAAERQRAHRLFGAYLAATGARRVVDKYPELVFRTRYVRAIFPDAHFIFLARNGWDTVVSIANWSARHGVTRGSERQDWWGINDRKWHALVREVAVESTWWAGRTDELLGLTRHIDRAAVEWVLTMNEGLARFSDGVPRATFVRYEQLANAGREAELEKLLASLGLEADEAVIRYAQAVLHPPVRHEPVELDPLVADPFARMMDKLGYDRRG